jgi:hypothetical protein
MLVRTYWLRIDWRRNGLLILNNHGLTEVRLHSIQLIKIDPNELLMLVFLLSELIGELSVSKLKRLLSTFNDIL